MAVLLPRAQGIMAGAVNRCPVSQLVELRTGYGLLSFAPVCITAAYKLLSFLRSQRPRRSANTCCRIFRRTEGGKYEAGKTASGTAARKSVERGRPRNFEAHDRPGGSV